MLAGGGDCGSESSGNRAAGLRLAELDFSGRLGVSDPAVEAVGRHLGDPCSAVGQPSRCLLTASADWSSSLPKANELRAWSRRMLGRNSVHGGVSGYSSNRSRFTCTALGPAHPPVANSNSEVSISASLA